MAVLIARVYLPKPSTTVEIPAARTAVTLSQAVSANRGGGTITGTVTTAGARPVCTFPQAVGPGRVRIMTSP